MAIFTATDPEYAAVPITTTTSTTGFYAGLQRATDLEVSSAMPTAISTSTADDLAALDDMSSMIVDSTIESHTTSKSSSSTSSKESFSATAVGTTLKSSYYTGFGSLAASSILGTPSTLSPILFESSTSSPSSTKPHSSSLPSSASASSSGSRSIKFGGNDGYNDKMKLILIGLTSVSLLIGAL